MTGRVSWTDQPPRRPSEEMEFFLSKGTAPADQRFNWRDVWLEEHARMFVVAKADSDAVLEAIRSEYVRNREAGMGLADFQNRLRPQLEALGWWGKAERTDPLTGETKLVQLGSLRRLEVIYDANMRASYAAGQWAKIQRLKASRPWLRYRQLQRPTKRDEHARYHDLIRPVDDPIWLRIFPPNGWFCSCSVEQLSDADLERLGLTPTEDFEIETRDWLNARTGAVERIPLGVDPGWHGNPGAAWLDLRAAHDKAAPALSSDLRAVERGLSAEIRARGLRDGEESLVLYDLTTGRPLDWARGQKRSVGPTQAMLKAMEDPDQRVAAVHNHPSSSAFSPADISVLLDSPGLEALLAIGHDGSVYRAMRRRKRPSQRDRLMVKQSYDAARQLLDHAVSSGAMPPADASALWAHLAALILGDIGVIRFEAGLSLRRQQILDRHAPLIDGMLDAVRRASRGAADEPAAKAPPAPEPPPEPAPPGGGLLGRLRGLRRGRRGKDR